MRDLDIKKKFYDDQKVIVNIPGYFRNGHCGRVIRTQKDGRVLVYLFGDGVTDSFKSVQLLEDK